MLNNVDQQYHDIINRILETGVIKSDRTGTGTQAVVGSMLRFDLKDGKIPLLTTKEVKHKSLTHEMLWFISGDTNIRYLKENNVGIWDSWRIEGSESYGPLSADECRKAIIKKLDISNAENMIVPSELTDGANWKVIDNSRNGVIPKLYINENFIQLEEDRKHLMAEQDVVHWQKLYKEILDKPPVKLIGADIGQGGYGAQWRRWEDTRICTDSDLSIMLKRGYDIVTSYLDGDVTKHVIQRKVDQLANAIKLLKTNPDSRRIIVNAWNPGKLEDAALPPCFEAGTLVATPYGYKAIETIEEGDLILSGTGKPSRVNQKMITPYNGEMISLKVMYAGPRINCTPNHPFLIKDKGFVEAKDINPGDFIGIPKTTSIRDHSFTIALPHGNGRIRTELVNLSIDDYYTLGYFMGNGWASKTANRISFAIPHSKLDTILPRIRKTIKVSRKPGDAPNVSTYETRSDKWIDLFREFGHKAPNKRIPQWVMESTVEAKEIFLEGFFDADGHFPYLGAVSVCTTSPSIAYGIQRLLADFNLVPSVRFQKKNPTHVIEGRVVNQNNVWHVDGKIPKNKSQAIMDESYMWVPVKNIEKYTASTTVYNFDVDGEHTYMVQNLATHNCHLYYQFISHEMTLKERAECDPSIVWNTDPGYEVDEELMHLTLDHREVPRRKLTCFMLLR